MDLCINLDLRGFLKRIRSTCFHREKKYLTLIQEYIFEYNIFFVNIPYFSVTARLGIVGKIVKLIQAHHADRILVIIQVNALKTIAVTTHAIVYQAILEFTAKPR